MPWCEQLDIKWAMPMVVQSIAGPQVLVLLLPPHPMPYMMLICLHMQSAFALHPRICLSQARLLLMQYLFVNVASNGANQLESSSAYCNMHNAVWYVPIILPLYGGHLS